MKIICFILYIVGGFTYFSFSQQEFDLLVYNTEIRFPPYNRSSIYIKYPQIIYSDSILENKINNWIRDIPNFKEARKISIEYNTDTVCECSIQAIYSYDISILFKSSTIISIKTTFEQLYCCAPNGYSEVLTANFNLSSVDNIISINNLFNENDYDTLSIIILSSLIEQNNKLYGNNWNKSFVPKTIDLNTTQFSILEDKLIFCIGQSTHTNCEFFAEIPYEKIKKLIKPECVLKYILK